MENVRFSRFNRNGTMLLVNCCDWNRDLAAASEFRPVMAEADSLMGALISGTADQLQHGNLNVLAW